MRRVLCFTLLIFAVTSCTPSDPTAGWAGSSEVLPNGAVRVTNPAEGIWTGETAWRLIPERVIGEMDAEDPYVFAAISGLAVDSAGQIFVLDRQANELRIFGPDGVHRRTVGRSGEGPGEYSNANGLAWLSEDTLVVIDQPGNRYSVLTREGDFVRSIPRNLSFFGWVYSGGVEGSIVYEVFHVGQEENQHPALLGTSLRPMMQAEAAVTAVEAPPEPNVPAIADTIMLPEPSAPAYESFSVRTERGGMVMGVPFTGRPVHTMDGAGHIWHGHGSLQVLYQTSLEGDTLTEIRIDWPANPVTEDEIEQWESSSGVQRFRDMGGKLETSRIPESKPYFDDLIIADDGSIWLTVPGEPNGMILAVLDSDGRYLGQLSLPGIARLSYLRPVIRDGRLYFAGSDELGVQRVYVYKVER